MGIDELPESADSLLGVLACHQLGAGDRRQVPVRLARQRRFRLAQRARFVAGGERPLGQRETRFRQFQIRRQHGVEQTEHGLLVRDARQHAVQVQQVLAEVVLVARQQGDQMRLQLIDLTGMDEQRQLRLAGRRRFRFDVQPQFDQRQGAGVVAGETGDLDGTGDHLRVTGALGEVGPGLHAESDRPLAQRQFAEQDLKHGAPEQILAGRRGSPGRQAEGQGEGDDELLRGHVGFPVGVRI